HGRGRERAREHDALLRETIEVGRVVATGVVEDRVGAQRVHEDQDHVHGRGRPPDRALRCGSGRRGVRARTRRDQRRRAGAQREAQAAARNPFHGGGPVSVYFCAFLRVPPPPPSLRRYAWMKSSRSPSRTAWMLPFSTSVRRSLTI